MSLYLRLRRCNPAPFAGYFDLGDFQIVSASPERFLRVSRPAGRDAADQGHPAAHAAIRPPTAAADAELLASEKDRAENVMIVDLLRNDLSRVCQPRQRAASASSAASKRIEYVQHLVSAVRGRLRDGRARRSTCCGRRFPAARSPARRRSARWRSSPSWSRPPAAPYCGSLGYLGFDGSLDLNILIRTITAGRGWWQFPVGGGIVAQSSPEAGIRGNLAQGRRIARRVGRLTSMILLIDNYDSFVYNLARYFERLGQATRVVRNTAIDAAGVRALRPAAIVLSPGPCTPDRAGCSLELVRRLHAQRADAGHLPGPSDDRRGAGRPDRPRATSRSTAAPRRSITTAAACSPACPIRWSAAATIRWSSTETSLPECLEVTARTDDGTIMAMQHRTLPVVGLQFHPESILTDMRLSAAGGVSAAGRDCSPQADSRAGAMPIDRSRAQFYCVGLAEKWGLAP